MSDVSTPWSPESRRLLVALALSGLLHAGLILSAGLDTRVPADPSATTLPPMQVLDVRTHVEIPHPPATPEPTSKAPPVPTSAGETDTTPAPGATRKAQPLDPIDLDLPEARLLTVHGRLVLKLSIDAQGRVVAYEAEPTSLPVEYVSAVAEALAGVRFAPALAQGRAIPSVYRIEIETEPVDAPR